MITFAVGIVCKAVPIVLKGGQSQDRPFSVSPADVGPMLVNGIEKRNPMHLCIGLRKLNLK